MNVLKSYEEVVAFAATKKILVVEGARCVGKSHLIEQLREQDPSLRYFEILHPRKRFVTPDSNGRAILPLGLTIQHGHFWSMDCIRQLVEQDFRFVVNRGMLSGQFFDPPNKELMDLWGKLLEQCCGAVLLVHPPAGTHSERIRAAKRSHEATSISAEKAGLLRLAQLLPSSIVSIFS